MNRTSDQQVGAGPAQNPTQRLRIAIEYRDADRRGLAEFPLQGEHSLRRCEYQIPGLNSVFAGLHLCLPSRQGMEEMAREAGLECISKPMPQLDGYLVALVK